MCEFRETFVDDDGRLRYRANPIVRKLLDESAITLGHISSWYENGEYTEDDVMEFYQLIGYSVGGFNELFTTKS